MPAAIANRARAESTSTNDRWTAASADVVTDLSWSNPVGEVFRENLGKAQK